MNRPQRIAVLGATGSIGESALDVIARHPQRFRASVLSAQTRVDLLLGLCQRFQPDVAIIADSAHYPALRDGLAAAGLKTQPQAGPQALVNATQHTDIDTVIAAIVGAAGVASTLAAAQAGKRILLANKESIVLAGELLIAAARDNHAQLIPVDSEHNAVFQCLPANGGRAGVRKIVLTASGGPFRGMRREQLADITPEQACAHPNWAMGRKISVDSATMMNKGLEVIEAHHLFGLPAEQIEVIIHRQSIIHSLVDYVDGSMLAQLGNPDMRTALACALAWPDRIDSGVAALDLATAGRFDFEPVDGQTFPCLPLAYQALRAGGSAPAVLNAANEVAVSAFLQEQLAFLQIPVIIERTLSALDGLPSSTLEQRLQADTRARELAQTFINDYHGSSKRPDLHRQTSH